MIPDNISHLSSLFLEVPTREFPVALIELDERIPEQKAREHLNFSKIYEKRKTAGGQGPSRVC